MKFMFISYKDENGKMASWRYAYIYVLFVAFTISCHIALHHIISYHVFFTFGITGTLRHVESMSPLSCDTMKFLQVWLHLLVQLCIEQLEPWEIKHWDRGSFHLFFGSHEEIQELGRYLDVV